MKYFFLTFLVLVLLAVGLLGFRGQKFSSLPIRIFPDMDEQDKVRTQKPSGFFHDGMGSRLPVQGTVPHSSDDGLFPIEFGAGRTGHYYTGAVNDYFANGFPAELELTADNTDAFLRRGEDRYAIFCAICHGEAGDGKGVISGYMAAAIANFHDPRFGRDQYPDGKVFHVITHGQGLMGDYGASIPVRDRWAIVGYVRSIQEAKKAELAAAKEAAPPAEEEKPAEGKTDPGAEEPQEKTPAESAEEATTT